MTGWLTVSRPRPPQIGICHDLPKVQALVKTVLMCLFEITCTCKIESLCKLTCTSKIV